jgi:two-component system sensor histidine kinase KdpD
VTPRPDPDALLRKVQEAEALSKRAKLKVFFGAAPGVGKTYAMLSEARERKDIGIDVVVGVVETHGRSETAVKAEGFERLPPKELPYHGKFYPEFDLDAALRRKPQLILMDELAHTNMQGSRHGKRWQDVMELLDAGIDVYTTINVQHMESLRDVVAQITGIVVREGVPDTVLERADEVELVDLPPEDLLQRLREGKVYVPEQARHAIDRFFRKGNLLALRELALRQTAQNVDAQMRRYMASEGIQKTWAAGDRLLVCVGPSALTARLIRATRRMAAGLGAPWIALYVETTRHLRYSEEDQARIEANLRLAEQLGGETAVVQGGTRIGSDILAFARDRNVTKIVVGKPTRPRWTDLVAGSLLEELVRGSGDIDVFVVTGDPETEAARPVLTRRPAGPGPLAYAWAMGAVAAATLFCHFVFRRPDLADIVMVYLLAIVLVAARLGRWPSLLASLLSVAAFDWFFVPPYDTFAVSDLRHLGTFGVMLLVGMLISGLTDRIRQQARLARAREQRTQALYRLSEELARTGGSSDLVASAIHNIAEQFHGRSTVLLPDASGRLAPAGSEGFPLNPQELGVAHWVLEHGEAAGLGTRTLPGASATYLPLKGAGEVIGVMGLLPEGAPRWVEPDSLRLLEAFANQTALAIERALLAERASEAHRLADEERLRSALLSSVSHDLRTPLGGIMGAATTLLAGDRLAPAPRELVQTIFEESQRMHRLVANLLDLTRLESGSLKVAKEWVPMEELVGSALGRLEAAAGRDIRVELPPGLPMAHVDPVLFEQLMVNLLENALKHGADPIEIKAWSTGSSLILSIGDRGPGIPEGQEERIFDKLVRGPESKGAGLGLAICRGIAEAHGGSIRASNRHHTGGAKFYVTLPLGQAPPPPPEEDNPMEG